MGGVPHGLPGTGCDREGVPLDEGRSPGDAAQRESGGHVERISLHCIPQFDPPDAVAETHEGYGSPEALYAGGGAAGIGEDQEDPVGKRRGHHDGVHEKATDDPGDTGGMRLTQREVRDQRSNICLQSVIPPRSNQIDCPQGKANLSVDNCGSAILIQ